MLGFISFSIKIVIAAAIGGLINYKPNTRYYKNKIVESSLLCIIGTSILSLSSSNIISTDGFSIGLGVLSVIITTIYISKNKSYHDKMIYLLSGIAGMLIGLGYIFKSIIFVILVYNILQNSDKLVDYFKHEDKITDENL